MVTVIAVAMLIVDDLAASSRQLSCLRMLIGCGAQGSAVCGVVYGSARLVYFLGMCFPSLPPLCSGAGCRPLH